LVGYIDESEFPEYVIKCIDSTGGITYKNIFLSDYGYTPVSGILTSSFYKVDTTNSGTLTDDLWRSCKTLSILFSTSQFSTWLQTLRESYSEVRLLLKIKNWSGTNNAVMYKAENNFV
jgi:hypothetical protein